MTVIIVYLEFCLELDISNQTKVKSGEYLERKNKIDIQYDKYRRPYLVYGVQKSFGEKIEEGFGIVKIDRNIKKKQKYEERESQNFIKSLHVPESVNTPKVDKAEHIDVKEADGPEIIQ